MLNYKNKVIWITGASSGIGRALCLALDKAGAQLILSARNKTALDEVMNKCENPDAHHILTFDLTEASSNDSIVKRAWSFHQKIDVLINNAGISQRSLAIDTDLAVDRKVMEIDYFATVALTKGLLPLYIKQQHGLIVNIASVAGKLGSPMRSAYSGAKHALIGFMDCLRAEVAEHNIRVVNVCPGFVNTNISNNALTGDMSVYNKMDEEIAQGMQVDKFVAILLNKLTSSKQEIIIASGLAKFGYQLRRFFPNIFHWMLPKIYQRRS